MKPRRPKRRQWLHDRRAETCSWCGGKRDLVVVRLHSGLADDKVVIPAGLDGRVLTLCRAPCRESLHRAIAGDRDQRSMLVP